MIPPIPSEQAGPQKRRLGDLLVAEGVITDEQLQHALREQRGTTEKLGAILVRMNVVTEDRLVGFLARQYRMPSVTLSRVEIDRCQTCNGTGMKGRVAIYEVMTVTEELRDLILKNASTADLRAMAQAQGMKTLRQSGLAKVLDGTTTVDEVLRVTLS